MTQRMHRERRCGTGNGPGKQLTGTGQIANGKDVVIAAIHGSRWLGEVGRPHRARSRPEEVFQVGSVLLEVAIAHLLQQGSWQLGEHGFEAGQSQAAVARIQYFQEVFVDWWLHG